MVYRLKFPRKQFDSPHMCNGGQSWLSRKRYIAWPVLYVHVYIH